MMTRNAGRRRRYLDVAFVMVSLTLLLLSLFIIFSNGPANHYEFSVYNAYPLYVWVFIACSLSIGQFIVLRGAFAAERSRLWVMGYLMILGCNSVLLMIPFLRGYTVYGRYDVLTHVGYMHDIIVSGHIGQSNMYPIEHVLGSSVAIVSNIQITTIPSILPQVFTMLFFLSLILLVRFTAENRSQILVGYAFFTILLFSNSDSVIISHVTFAPNALSFFMLPLMFFAFMKCNRSRNARYAIITLILIVTITLVHPLSSLVMIAFMAIWELARRRYSTWSTTSTSARLPDSKILLLIGVTVYLASRAYSVLVFKSLHTVVEMLLGSGTGSEFQIYAGGIGMWNVRFGDVIVFLFLSYGAFVIIGLISFMSILNPVRRAVKIEGVPIVRVLSIAGFLMFIFLSLGVFLSSFITGFGRILAYSILFSFLLIPAYFFPASRYRSEERGRIWKRRIIGPALTLFLISSLCIITIFPSPLVRTENQQVTTSELEGMRMFEGARGSDIPAVGLGIVESRFVDALYGVDEHQFSVVSPGAKTTPVDHFGYDKNDTLGEVYSGSRYLLINEVGRGMYQSLYQDYQSRWRFEPSDFAKLNSDTNVQSILSNGNVEAYLILNGT
jgi:hypothetical protein